MLAVNRPRVGVYDTLPDGYRTPARCSATAPSAILGSVTTSIGDTVDRARALLGPLDWDETSVNDRGELVLPSGTVTLLLADVEGSTRGWEERAEEMTGALEALGEVVDATLGWHQGVRPVEQGEGDSFVAAFSRASDAVACALEIQRQLARNPLRLRMGVHTGEVQLRDEGNYAGPAINRTARLRDAAHGGQVVLSQATCELVRDRLPDGAALRDLGVHRLKDLGRPEHVYQLVHPELGDDFPPLRSVDHLPNNLPAQLTSFVGREPELAVLRKLLGETRMLTLTGSGGCGKTRLALELAARALERFPDGTWLVDLTPVTDPELVPNAVATAVGVRDQPGRRSTRCTRRSSRVADRARGARQLRAPRRRGRRARRTDPARLPRGRGARDEPRATRRARRNRVARAEPVVPQARTSRRASTTLTQYEAVQLFVERARKVRPNFTIDGTTAAPVAAICHRLDGIPLAVELAAARTRVLSPQQILDGLDDRFRLLTGGARTAVARQQTLRASVDWSYELLTDAERRVVRAAVGVRRWLLARRGRGRGGRRARRRVRGVGSAPEPRRPVAARRRRQSSQRCRRCALPHARDHPAVRGRAPGRLGRGRQRADPALRVLRRARRAGRAAPRTAPSRRRGPTGSTSRTRTSASRSGMRTIVGTRSARSGWSPRCSGGGSSAGISASAPRCAGSRWSSPARFDPRCARPRSSPRVTSAGSASTRVSFRSRRRRSTPRGKPGTAASKAGPSTTRGVWAGAGGCRARGRSRREHRDRAARWATNGASPSGLAAAGTALNDAGRITAAAAVFEEALAVCDELGERYIANTVRYKLARRAAPSSVAPPRAKRCCAKSSRTPAAPETSSPSRWPSRISVSPERCRVTSTAAWRSSQEDVELLQRSRQPWPQHELQAYGILGNVLFMAGRFEEARAPLEIAEAKGRALSPLADDIVALTLSIQARVEQALGERGSRPCAQCRSARAAGRHLRLARGVDPARRRVHRARRRRPRHRGAHGARSAGQRDRSERSSRSRSSKTVPVLDTLAAITDDARRGARLLGAVDALMQYAGHVRDAVRATSGTTRAVKRFRDELGADAFDAAVDEGARLSLEEAIAYAQRGRGQRRRSARGWDSLTPTELEVVKLVAEGLSNPDIAERLFVSRKTVTTHLTHVFAKLGVSSRSELASMATRQGV